jgi:predicted transposase/invertase (TIGR01784 family)
MAVLWLRYLTEIDESTSEAPAELLENEDTRKALQIVEKSAFTEGQLYAYEQFWDAVVNERVLRQKAKREGHAEGFAEGHAEGHAEGFAEGQAERNVEIARSMKADNLPTETIMKYTGLTAVEIEAL